MTETESVIVCRGFHRPAALDDCADLLSPSDRTVFVGTKPNVSWRLTRYQGQVSRNSTRMSLDFHLVSIFIVPERVRYHRSPYLHRRSS
jgi:hypothetical protein